MIVTSEQLLRRPCEAVDLEDVPGIVSKLEIELEQSSKAGNAGIGLAAPQIGILKKVAIVRVQGRNINLVNPVVLERRRPIIFENEGCLSFPGQFVKTKRFDEIVVENGVEPKKFIATGLVAVAVAHEIDHLLNILLPELAIPEIIVKKKVRPNDLCTCGSGKKYKKCCMK